MGAEPIHLRTSCLIERAYACAARFDRMGLRCSAETSRLFARQLEDGMPPALLEYQVAAQEKRAEAKARSLTTEGRI